MADTSKILDDTPLDIADRLRVAIAVDGCIGIGPRDAKVILAAIGAPAARRSHNTRSRTPVYWLGYCVLAALSAGGVALYFAVVVSVIGFVLHALGGG